MRNETDLNRVKWVAKQLVMIEPHLTEFSPVVVQHPFTSSGMVAIPSDEGIKHVDITKSPEELVSWQNYMKAQIDEAKSAYHIYMMTNKPYSMTFLKFAKPHLSQKDFSEILADAWIRSENPNLDKNFKQKELLQMFKDNLWYECKEEVLLTYSQSLPKRVSLSQNKEFKSVRNTVIEEAMNIVMRNALTNETLGDELPDPDYYITETDDVQIDPADESDNFTEKAESSDKWRPYALAKRLLDRETEYYNPSEAVHCLIQAAMQNLSVAKYRLGKLFLKGEDVPPNSTYALYWLEEAVKDDNPYAEYLLGKVYLKGEYVDKDIEKATELLKSSAEQNNKYAAYTLGKLYLDGTTAPQDIEQALKYLTRSADNGFATAQYLLGKLLYSGELMPISINKALEYLLSAAEQGNPFAAYLAGKIMLNEDTVKNIKEAVRCFEIAAEQGNSYAEYQLGKIYLYGVDNDKDYSQALGWLTSSAAHGNPYAVRLLHSIRSNRNQYACMAAIRLLHHISRMIKNRLEDERKIGGAVTDRKLMRKIEEKKQAQGIKMG